MARKIAVVTGSRADFGLLAPVMRAIDSHRRLSLQVIVTGLHLSTGTWRQVESAGFEIEAKPPMQHPGEVGRSADVAALGRGVIGLGRVFSHLAPDVVLVLGDRIEAFAAASAASVGGYLLGHIHGGDRAEGVADEAMRHAISKLAHLHFAATAQSRRRLIRMGESPDRVHRTGSPAIDGLDAIAPAPDTYLQDELDLDPSQPFVMVLHHPRGATDSAERRVMSAILAATAKHQRLVLEPNHDPGRRGVMDAIRQADVEPISNMSRPLFVSLLKRCGALIGNSSTGLIEATSIRRGGMPVVNVGDRQAGRERPSNVIDCGESVTSIRRALQQALTDPPRCRRSPYGDGRAAVRIADHLAGTGLDAVERAKFNLY